MRAFDRYTQFLGHHAGLAAVVDMAMGQQDFLDRRPGLRRGGLQFVEVAARIDKGSGHRLGAPQQGAILLKRRDRNDRRSERGLRHFAGSSVAIEAGWSFISAATASARHVVFHHPESKLAMVGDVLFQGSIGRTDFPRGNHQQLLDSITQRLWPMGDDTRFVPGHGPMSTFGHERATNPFVADKVLARA